MRDIVDAAIDNSLFSVQRRIAVVDVSFGGDDACRQSFVDGLENAYEDSCNFVSALGSRIAN